MSEQSGPDEKRDVIIKDTIRAEDRTAKNCPKADELRPKDVTHVACGVSDEDLDDSDD